MKLAKFLIIVAVLLVISLLEACHSLQVRKSGRSVGADKKSAYHHSEGKDSFAGDVTETEYRLGPDGRYGIVSEVRKSESKRENIIYFGASFNLGD